MKENKKIRWEYEGKPDYINGTGAYPEEKFIAFFGSALLPALVIYQLITGHMQWNIIQIVIGLYFALDLGGGLVSNALNSCKRYYDSPIKPEETGVAGAVKKMPVFIAAHVHPLVVGLLFNDMNWTYALTWYAAFLISVLIVFKTPLYLKRAVGKLLAMVAIVVSFYLFTPVPGFEWFIPILFMKIITGHMIPEEPYDK
jgi:nitrate/nitrite transporter NarK